jgi:hypothetical protein
MVHGAWSKEHEARSGELREERRSDEDGGYLNISHSPALRKEQGFDLHGTGLGRQLD